MAATAARLYVIVCVADGSTSKFVQNILVYLCAKIVLYQKVHNRLAYPLHYHARPRKSMRSFLRL